MHIGSAFETCPEPSTVTVTVTDTPSPVPAPVPSCSVAEITNIITVTATTENGLNGTQIVYLLLEIRNTESILGSFSITNGSHIPNMCVCRSFPECNKDGNNCRTSIRTVVVTETLTPTPIACLDCLHLHFKIRSRAISGILNIKCPVEGELDCFTCIWNVNGPEIVSIIRVSL